MITQEDIDAFAPVDTDDMRMVARTCQSKTAPQLLEDAANEIDKLRAALEPFVHAYSATCEAFGFDIGPQWKTANMVSQPYILMEHYVAAHAALIGTAWTMPPNLLDDLTFKAADGETYRYEHYGNAPPPEEFDDDGA